jgi:ABC-type amino acid transport substrate-binding protein
MAGPKGAINVGRRSLNRISKWLIGAPGRLMLLSIVTAAAAVACPTVTLRSKAETIRVGASWWDGTLPHGGKNHLISLDWPGVAASGASGITAWEALSNLKHVANLSGNRAADKTDFAAGPRGGFMHSRMSFATTASKPECNIERLECDRSRSNVPSARRLSSSLFGGGQTLPVTYVATGASTAASGADRPLRVAVAAIAPFVLPQTDTPMGFSIELWSEVARRLHVEFAWSSVATQSDLLLAVQRGDADVAIAAITMTPEREKVVDFSLPYFDSGLQIMVRARNESAFLATLRSIPWRAIGQLFGMAAILVFLLANLVWLVERKQDPNFQKPYVRALGEGLWATMLIIATGEHGERDSATMLKRVLVPAMWLIGVVLIAQLTATVTSSQTVAQLQSNIQGPGDLPGKTIGTAAGTIAADYLTQRGLPFVDVKTADDGIRMLTQGDVQAIVYDAPTLQYWAAKRGNGVLLVVGPIFRPEKYGIALAEGSTLRKPINEALLSMYADGTYEKIYGKWFTQGR